jgi:hypothetical protein
LEILVAALENPPSPAEIRTQVAEIHADVVRDSKWLDAANFTRFHPADLQRLFDEYDRRFFDGGCREALNGRRLTFRISARLTSSAGTTTSRKPRNGSAPSYEIAMSSTLLFQTFASDDHRPIQVNGLTCRDRLEAMQRVFEHELVHLIEMLVWDNSNCAAGRFQSIVARHFGHTDYRHRLITPREKAFVRFGIRPGGRVRFDFEGHTYTGVVNRVTRRATVLVPDPRGELYTDGIRYLKFYIPISQLQPIDAR